MLKQFKPLLVAGLISLCASTSVMAYQFQLNFNKQGNCHFLSPQVTTSQSIATVTPGTEPLTMHIFNFEWPTGTNVVGVSINSSGCDESSAYHFDKYNIKQDRYNLKATTNLLQKITLLQI